MGEFARLCGLGLTWGRLLILTLHYRLSLFLNKALSNHHPLLPVIDHDRPDRYKSGVILTLAVCRRTHRQIIIPCENFANCIMDHWFDYVLLHHVTNFQRVFVFSPAGLCSLGHPSEWSLDLDLPAGALAWGIGSEFGLSKSGKEPHRSSVRCWDMVRHR